MNKWSTAFVVAGLLMSLVALRTYADGGCGCACRVECPHCHHVCEFSVEKEKVKQHCWEVECVPTCVPDVCFSLQDLFAWKKKSCCQSGGGGCCDPHCAGLCQPRCGKVRYIHVLKRKEHECERCKCKFTPKLVPGCQPCDYGGCN